MSASTSPADQAPAAMPAEWPADGIETLGQCPVCASKRRSPLYLGLRDRIFHCAPGSWDLQGCGECGTGYLDPRPTPDSIHLAYRNYYTHDHQAQRPASELHGLRRLQRVFANGYKNWRFGTDLQPSSALGVAAAFLLPVLRATLDRQYRHLPRRAGGRVLDVGFGDGGFLENAMAMGWEAVGTDFDGQVVENARRRGLDARLGTTEGIEGLFDVITMNHVIEHFHDPVAVLRACRRLLKPGGTLWLETPSIEATGLRRFGADWRGLEPPRHLVLFSPFSLRRALRDTGFTDIRDLRQASPVVGMYEMSQSIRDRVDPYGAGRAPLRLRLEMMAVKLFEWLWKPRREFLAVTARAAA